VAGVRPVRLIAAWSAVLAIAGLLAGCGGGASVDKGGFSSSDRVTAQAALDALQKTSISGALLRLAHAADFPPTACFVHLTAQEPARFELFLYWQPYTSYNRYENARSDYIFFDSSIGADLKSDVFHVAFNQWQTPLIDALDQNLPKAVSTKPFEKCELLENGYVRLLPSSPSPGS